MGAIKRIALLLVIIGAINWGLIGLFNFDLVATLFGGADATLSEIIYSLVGLSGLICLPLLFASSKEEDTANVRGARMENMRYSTEFAEEQEVQRDNEVLKNKNK